MYSTIHATMYYISSTTVMMQYALNMHYAVLDVLYALRIPDKGNSWCQANSQRLNFIKITLNVRVTLNARATLNVRLLAMCTSSTAYCILCYRRLLTLLTTSSSSCYHQLYGKALSDWQHDIVQLHVIQHIISQIIQSAWYRWHMSNCTASRPIGAIGRVTARLACYRAAHRPLS